VPTDAERDPVEWAQHTALVAISVARTVLDLAEAAVADRERLERLATTGRSFAETWLGDAARLASTVASGFGFEGDTKAPATPPSGEAAQQRRERPATTPTAARVAAPTAGKRPAKRAAPRPRATPAQVGAKKAAKARAGSKGRKAAPTRPKQRKK
jgi:hypothetical protein